MSDIPIKRVLLLGKTGDGKSFCGNLILGRLAFVTSDGSASVTQKCSKKSRVDETMLIEFQVIDTIGLFDTGKCPDDVHKILSEFATLAPSGIHAVLVVIPGERFKQATITTLGAIERFFGRDIWAHSIIVYNQCDKTPDEVWGSTDRNEMKYIKKWRDAGASICTLPSVDVDEASENLLVNEVQEIIMCRRMEPRLATLKTAIRDADKIYDPEEFQTLRGELEALAKEALEAIKTDTWRPRMLAENKLLLDGRADRETWKKSRDEIHKSDADAAWQQKQLAAGRAVVGTALAGAVVTGAAGGVSAYRAGKTGAAAAWEAGAALLPGMERGALVSGSELCSLAQDCGGAVYERATGILMGAKGKAESTEDEAGSKTA
mmetsp:Transcript_34623/g.83588  ORF Transcript_34623/g.83588 Transcript_34623/m.83588 type:complete len:377 (+) Transcript_34623:63-1193(+)